jgi:hypothetical protein
MDNKTIKILSNNSLIKDETIETNMSKPLIDKSKLLNLLELSKVNKVKIFDDKKGKIRSKRQIIDDCIAVRNQKIDSYVKNLDEKKNKTKTNTKIKILNDNFMKELHSIESMVNSVNTNNLKALKTISDSPLKDDLKTDKSNKTFIEIFSNDPIVPDPNY